MLDTRGLIRFAEGDTKAAVDDFKTAVADLPSAVNYFHLAMGEEKLGNATAATEAFAKAEELKLDSTQLSPSEQRDYKRLQKSLAKPGKVEFGHGLHGAPGRNIFANGPQSWNAVASSSPLLTSRFRLTALPPTSTCSFWSAKSPILRVPEKSCCATSKSWLSKLPTS